MTEFRGPCRNGKKYPLGRLGKSWTPEVPLKKSGLYMYVLYIYIFTVYICSQEMISNLIMIDAKRFLWWRTLSTIPLEMGEWKPPCLSEWDVLCHRWSLVIYDEIWWHMLTCANEDMWLSLMIPWFFTSYIICDQKTRTSGRSFQVSAHPRWGEVILGFHLGGRNEGGMVWVPLPKQLTWINGCFWFP